MSRPPLVVIGDALLDRDVDGRVERICPDAPAPVVEDPVTRSRPGGAGLAAVLAAADGHPVTLLTAVAGDDAGTELHDLLASRGVDVVAIPTDGTTAEKIRIRAAGQPLVRLDRGTPGALGRLPAAAMDVLAGAGAVLVADYGRGVAGHPDVREALGAGRAPVVWDPHPRGPEPVPGARLATPNRAEAAARVEGIAGDGLGAATERARALRTRWEAVAVAVTLGARGALMVDGDGPPLVVPATTVAAGDPCGAGDRFASRAAGLLAEGALPSEAVAGAVAAASAFVAAGGAGAMEATATAVASGPTPSGRRGARQLVAQVRAAGGTVVATGGCFDLLHAGHVAMLQAARRLGDCLVVCLNSDDSIRRIKGPGRPVTGETDRAALLTALDCVDAVAVFHEPTPEAVLTELQPDVFAKGGDYAGTDLPEAAVLARWGGQAVVLPYLHGRSTTRLLQEVRANGSP